MATKYRIAGQIRHSTKDSFTNGCELHGVGDWPENDSRATFDDPRALLAFIKERTRCTQLDAYQFNACEEKGRIDVQFNSATPHGRPQSAAHAEAWKAGTADSYLVNWSFYVERIEPEDCTDYAEFFK